MPDFPGALAGLAILVAAGLITHLLARAMYVRCPECGILNARRRRRCRACGREIQPL